MSSAHDPHRDLPVDPDVTTADLRPSGLGRDLVAVVALGGALGALARWGLGEAIPHDPGHLPWATLLANVSGCFLIGVLMVAVRERLSGRPWLRPFLGTGVLGGFTTFSTYAVDARTLVAHDHPATAAAYVVGSLALGLVAVVAGLRLTERVVR